MGRVLDFLERQQMQFWSLINGQAEFKKLLKEEMQQPNDQSSGELISCLDTILNEYEARLWQIVPIQMQLQLELLELKRISELPNDIKNENEQFDYDFGSIMMENGISLASDDDFNQQFPFPDEMQELTSADSTNTEPMGDTNVVDDALETLEPESLSTILAAARATFINQQLADELADGSKQSSKRSFKCKTCGKVFGRLTSLRQHMIFHTGIKPHICTQCNKSFFMAGDLKVHLKRHAGILDFKCTHCSKSFLTSASRKKHLRSCHPNAAEAK